MRLYFILALVLVFLVACTPESASEIGTESAPQPASTATRPNTTPAATSPEHTPLSPSATPGTETTLKTTDCAGADIRQLAESIAEDYPFTNGEEVMAWFCEGAEFEDILLALETEDLTGTPAEEMLEMLAEGFTWEEVWLVIGLTEE
jgi:hypothetical protein